MNAETYINSKLSLKERAVPVLVNDELIIRLMEEYAEIKIKDIAGKIESELWKLPSEITGV